MNRSRRLNAGCIKSNNSFGNLRSKALLPAALALLLLGAPLFACQVPVFRYALERWGADKYQIYVLHTGPLSDEAKQALEVLKDATKTQTGRPGLIEVKTRDLDQPANSSFDSNLAKWSQSNPPHNHAGKNELPRMLVFYPRANDVDRQEPMFHAELSEPNVSGLLDSPVRKELRKRLARGDSAVWIFVRSGKKQEDSEALDRLKQQLAADTKWLELPTPEELEVDASVLEETKIPLQIGFSVLEVSRDDPQERFLIESLLHSEDDLVSFDQPLAFPVFGQGRVLYCLVGKGISAETVRTASSFMAGPCSCQVKNQNPGFDLLLRADWKEALGDVLISEPIESPNTEALAPKLLTIPPGRKSSGRKSSGRNSG